jgi:hypothetical protein
MKKITFVASMAILFTACKSNQKQAMDYNNFINEVSISFTSKITSSTSKIQSLLSNKQFTQITSECYVMGKAIDSLTTVVEKKDAPSSASDLKKQFVNYLKFEKKVFQDGYLDFGKLTAASTQDDYDKIQDKFGALTKEESVMREGLGAAQKVFLEKNNIKALMPTIR